MRLPLYCFLVVFSGYTVTIVSSACADHAFLGCVLRLKAQRVPFERNILSVVFNVATEAKLLHTCKAYSNILPCFREKINDCGDEKQRRLLGEVTKMLMFLCTPFSLKRQQVLIANQKCISSILSLPASTGCKLSDHPKGNQVLACKKLCGARQSDFLCMMRSWISEQNVCTLRDIENKCGDEAAMLYSDMQISVFEPSFPVICDYKSALPPNNTNSIEIESRKELLSTTLPSHVNRVQIYRKPTAKNYTSTTTMPTPVIWTKKPSDIKTQYNKEVWRKKTANQVVMGTDPYETSTTTPTKTYKVYNLLRSLLPDNIPSQLSSFFENSLEKHSFTPTRTYNTPSITTFMGTSPSTLPPPTRSPTTASSTLIPTPLPYSTPNSYHPGRKLVKPPKWRPWYLGGTDE